MTMDDADNNGDDDAAADDAYANKDDNADNECWDR